MPMQLPTYKKTGICEDCGELFEKKSWNQVRCPVCDRWRKYGGRGLTEKMRSIEPRLKQAADESGNPVVWYRGDPIKGLPEGMRQRVETAMRFGI
jgi:hypothetical protein